MKRLPFRKEANRNRTRWICVCSLILLMLISFSSPLNGGQKSKVLLDTDLGDDIDDAWALAFVISHKDFDPVGVTVTHGDTATRAKLLETVKQQEVLVRDPATLKMLKDAMEAERAQESGRHADQLRQAGAGSRCSQRRCDRYRRE